jgi:HD-GYP domain
MYRNKMLENRSARSSFLNSLEQTLWVRSHETQEHTVRLRHLVIALGQFLGLTPDLMNNLTLLAALHDIGKIAIPNNILDKDEPLTPEEWEIMKKHPEIGYRIALANPELAHIAEAILHHHERWDGQGYPLGAKGQEIPLISRILAIADSYDVMISGRPYQPGFSQEEALQEIISCAGTQFDPELTLIFIDLIRSRGQKSSPINPRSRGNVRDHCSVILLLK